MTINYIRLYITFLICFFSIPLSAIEYTIENYNIDNGLVQSTVRALYQDDNGFIWIGTENGLSCFDGKEFKNFRDPKKLFSSRIAAIDQVPNGNLLILNFRGQLWEFDGQNFYPFKIAQLDTNYSINDFMLIGNQILIGTQNNGFFLCEGDSLKRWDDKNGLYHNRVRDILQDQYDIYIITDGGVNLFDGKTVQPLFKNKNHRFTSIIKSSHGEYWAGFQNEGIYRFIDGSWQPEYQNKWIYVNGMVESETTEIWVSSNIGLKRIIKNSLGQIYIFNDLNTLYVRSIIIDNENGVWCGTFGRGLFHLRRNLFFNITPDDGFPSYFAKIFLIDSKDRVWVHAASAGCVMYDNNRMNHFYEEGDISIRYMSGAAEFRSGEVLLAADNKLITYKDGKFEKFHPETEIPGRIFSVFIDSKDRIWLSLVRKGIWYLEKNEWKKFEKLPGNITASLIYEDSNSNLWFPARRNGVFKYNGNEIIHFSEETGLADNRAISIVEDYRGNIWVATCDGVNILRDDKVIDHLDITDGLPGNLVYSLGAYDELVFIGTADGLAIYNDGDIEFFTTNDGLSSNEISDGIIPINKWGKAWLGTTAGVSMFSVKNYTEHVYFSKAYITRIIADNDTTNFKFIGETQKVEDINFSSNMDFIRFDLNTISYSKEITSYRYKLTDDDSTAEWLYSDTKSLRIDNPVAGDYNLEIETKCFGEDWASAYSVPLIITDPFYKTKTFTASIFGFALFCAIGLYIFTEHQKKKNKYKTSSLNKSKTLEVKTKILDVIEGNEKYKDAKINLQQVSEEIAVPKEHISQVINSEFKQNFNDFVNSHRVDEAKKMLEKNGSLNMQILQIAYEVGFNSKSSFNVAFKKFTGLTPSEYKKQFAEH